MRGSSSRLTKIKGQAGEAIAVIDYWECVFEFI